MKNSTKSNHIKQNKTGKQGSFSFLSFRLFVSFISFSSFISFISFVSFISLSLFSGCHNDRNTKLEEALRLSGENRGELEKVLTYFSQNPGDSLKLKSAIFLIENMPGHWGPDSSCIQTYKTRIDSMSRLSFEERQILLNLPSRYPELCKQFTKAEDIHTIKAKDLIRHIEWACGLKDSCTWLKTIDQDNFNEYLLPYRLENEWAEFSSDTLHNELSELVTYACKNYNDCQQSAHCMGTYIERQQAFTTRFNIKDTSLRKHVLTEENHNKLAIIRLRQRGVPVALDYIPIHYPKDQSNYWHIILDSRLQAKYSYRAERPCIGKVYRQTFSHNPIPVADKDEFIPAFFQNPFQKDITELYLNTVDVNLSVNTPENLLYAYLTMYDGKEWQSVAYGKVDNKQCLFPKLGKDCLYLPVYYPKGQLQPLSSPFILRSTGQTDYLTVRNDSMINLQAERLGPYLNKGNYYNESLVNALFECSDHPDFKKTDTAFIIKQAPYYRLENIQLSRQLKKRYWRFLFFSYYASLSELQFLNPEGKQVKGRYITTDTNYISALTDNNPKTSKTIQRQLILDFGKAVEVATIRYMLASDNYNVWPGHEYELFYYQDKQWVSAGVKPATAHSITFNHVPANGLYQIKDNTDGTTGYAFTLEKGRVRFW